MSEVEFLAQVKKIGNSIGIIVPKKEAEKIELELGDWVRVRIKKVKVKLIVEEE